MEDLPNIPGAEFSDITLELQGLPPSASLDAEKLEAVLDAASDRFAVTLLLVAENGAILKGAGEVRFGTLRNSDQRSWEALWPLESRALAQEALAVALREEREIAIEVSRIPDGRSAQYWEARITPFSLFGPSSVARDAAQDGLLLVALRDVTSETRVRRLKAR